MAVDEWRRAIGPGLIFSGSAIGVSHLVQSTRAGAMYGLALIAIICIVNLLKYPAFRFGMDYAHATRKTLIAGYRELGPWAVPLYALTSLTIAPIGLAAVSVTTAAILAAVTSINLPILTFAALVISATLLLLLIGGYGWLDSVNQLLIAFLTATTIIAAVLALPRVEWASATDLSWSIDPAGLLFVVALAGFMPSPIGQSVQVSLWTLKSQEREAESERLSMDTMRRGFLAAYLLTGFLALCFCVMGAGVMHATGIAPKTGAAALAAQIINLYHDTLGPIPAYLAGISALCVMVTTMIAAFDGVARGFDAIYEEYLSKSEGCANQSKYATFLILEAGLSFSILTLLMTSFSVFIDLVTSIYFVVGPVIALLNHLVVTRCEMPESDRPTRSIKLLNISGILVMSAMAAMFFVLKAS